MTGGTFGYIRVFWEQQTIHIAFWTLFPETWHSKPTVPSSLAPALIQWTIPFSFKAKHAFPLIPGLYYVIQWIIWLIASALEDPHQTPENDFLLYSWGYLFICVPRNLFLSIVFHVFACSNIRRERERKREKDIPVECWDRATIKCSNRKIKLT